MIAEKVDACQKQQNRNPEGPQSEKPDEKTGHVSPDNAEQVLYLAHSPGIVDRRVRRTVG